MEQKDKYIDNSGDRKYFAMIPYYIVNHSSHYEQSLYLVIKRLTGESEVGTCFASLSELAKRMGTSRTTTQKTIKKLLERGWINFVGRRPARTSPVNEYRIVDLWEKNLEYIKSITKKSSPLGEQSYKKSSPQKSREQSTTRVESSPPSGHEEETVKKNNKEENGFNRIKRYVEPISYKTVEQILKEKGIK